MPTGIQQLGRENSDGAIVRGKGLVQLRHLAANAAMPPPSTMTSLLTVHLSKMPKMSKVSRIRGSFEALPPF
jgi:hypothetical protein